ncbi:GyrI-like domain-containing protein [Metabacillus litoralis]|uniref:GyrI-like domain-containing protein n=1 Tax=Metabacillus litoralis TaxID=152268 RepID=UPI001CFE6F02|nr:GyrI-like domain-containing protein [Metabacillus litoralis]
MKIEIKEKTAFQAFGVKWQGTFEQAEKGDVKKVLHQFRKDLFNTPFFERSQTIYGLSLQNIANGFTYYICTEVPEKSSLPANFDVFQFQSHHYAALDYKGVHVYQAYQTLYDWMKENSYQPVQNTIDHFDIYPITYEPLTDEPHLTIMIPIVMEKQRG